MDVRKATRDYITKMVSDVPGMKVFLLDNETVRRWSPSPCAGPRTARALTAGPATARGLAARAVAAPQTVTVSLVYSQTEILSKEVLLIEKLGQPSTRMKHMNAIVFVRPTLENVRMLMDELRDPKYNDYYICAEPARARAARRWPRALTLQPGMLGRGGVRRFRL